jgi:hypothetical protein
LTRENKTPHHQSEKLLAFTTQLSKCENSFDEQGKTILQEIVVLTRLQQQSG